MTVDLEREIQYLFTCDPPYIPFMELMDPHSTLPENYRIEAAATTLLHLCESGGTTGLLIPEMFPAPHPLMFAVVSLLKRNGIHVHWRLSNGQIVEHTHYT